MGKATAPAWPAPAPPTQIERAPPHTPQPAIPHLLLTRKEASLITWLALMISVGNYELFNEYLAIWPFDSLTEDIANQLRAQKGSNGAPRAPQRVVLPHSGHISYAIPGKNASEAPGEFAGEGAVTFIPTGPNKT